MDTKAEKLILCSSKDFLCSSKEVWSFLKLIQVLAPKLAKNGIDIETFQFFPFESRYEKVCFINESPLDVNLYHKLFEECQEEIVKEYPYIIRSSYQVVSHIKTIRPWFEAIGRHFFANVQSLDIEQYEELVCKHAAKFFPEERNFQTTIKQRLTQGSRSYDLIQEVVNTIKLFNGAYYEYERASNPNSISVNSYSAARMADLKAPKPEIKPSRIFTYHLTEEGKKAIETFETKLRNKKQTTVAFSLVKSDAATQTIETSISTAKDEICIEGGRNIRIHDVSKMLVPIRENFLTAARQLFDKIITEHAVISCDDYKIEGETLRALFSQVKVELEYEVSDLTKVLGDLAKKQSEARVCEKLTDKRLTKRIAGKVIAQKQLEENAP